MPNIISSPLEEHLHRATSASTVLRMALEATGDAPTRDELNAILAHAYVLEDSANAAQAAFRALVEAERETTEENSRKPQDCV